MIITKKNDYYLIKLLNINIDVYNPQELEDITKKIIKKITSKYKLNNNIHLEFYQNNNYGTIIKLFDIKSKINTINEKKVKITIYTNTTILYQIDFFDIKKTFKKNIYYYKNKFYIEIDDIISKKEYYKLLEISRVIYDNTDQILHKGIKI